MILLSTSFKLRKWVFLALLISSMIAAYLGFADVSLPNDKLIHFSTFFILTTLFYWAIDTSNRKALRLLCITCCVLIAGIGSEFAQELITPTRRFDYKDILSNECGSLLALTVSDFCNKKWGILRRTRRLTVLANDLELQQDAEEYETEEDGGTSNSSAYEYDDTVNGDADDDDDEDDEVINKNKSTNEFIMVDAPST